MSLPKHEPRVLRVNPDRKALGKLVNRKKYAVLAAVCWIALVHMRMSDGGRGLDSMLFQIYALLIFGVILLVVTLFRLIVNGAQCTFSLTAEEFTLNGRYRLDYPEENVPSCIVKSDSGRYWHFMHKGKRVQREYCAVYPDLDKRVSDWLKAGDNPQTAPEKTVVTRTVNQLLAASIKDLFAIEAPSVQKGGVTGEPRKRFLLIKKMNAAWFVFWLLLLPLAAETGIAVALLRTGLTIWQSTMVITGLLLLFSVFQFVFLFISNLFTALWVKFCNALAGSSRE